MIVNFAAKDSGIGSLAKAVPRVDPNTEGTQQWDIDIAFGVDEVQAKHVEPALPSSSSYLATARDGKGSATITIKPTQRDIRLTLASTDGDSDVLMDDVAAEIRQIKLTLTEKAQSYVARLRVYGLSPESGARVLSHLGKPVTLYVDQIQLELDYGISAPIGSVVTGSNGMEDVYGILAQKRGDQFIIDDFGVLHTVDAINASIMISASDLSKAETEYANSTRMQGFAPSWKHLMNGLGVHGVDDGITDAVIAFAIEWHLPPEVGTSNG